MAINSHNDERWNRQLEVMWKLQKNKNDNEIKKILDKIRNVKEPEMYITPKTGKKLIDYITNLQEENEQLKKDIELLISNEDDNDSVWFEEDNM